MRNKKHHKKQNNNIKKIILKFLLGFFIPYTAINFLIFFIYTKNPSIIVEEYDADNHNIDEINFHIKNKLPIKNISILLNEETSVAFKKTNYTYVLPIKENGSYI